MKKVFHFLALLLIGTTIKAQPTRSSGQPILMLPIGHTSGIMSVSFSPDGKYIVTTGWWENEAKIWDVSTGNLLVNLKGHISRVISAQFSPDGKKIVTTSFDLTAKIWDVSTGNLLVNLKGHKSWVSSAQFSADGKKIVTASNDGTAKVWDADTGLLLFDLKDNINYVISAQFSPDGKKIVTAGGDSMVKIWNVAKGTLLFNLKGHTKWVNSAQFSAGGKKIVTASEDGTAKIWDASTGNLLADLKGHTLEVSSAQFSPDGKKIVTASNDGTAKVWDAALGKIQHELILWPSSNINKNAGGWWGKARFNPDGKKIITIASDSIVQVWDAFTGSLLFTLKSYTSQITKAQFSPDGKKIITTSWDNTFKLWDANTGILVLEYKKHSKEFFSADFSPDGKTIITASEDGTAKVRDAVTYVLLANLKGHKSVVLSAQFSPDGKKIVTASGDSTAKVWDAVTATALFDLKGHKDVVLNAKFSPDGKKIVTASRDGTARVWDAVSGKIQQELVLWPSSNNNKVGWMVDAQFSPDGKKIIAASMDSIAKIWEASSGILLSEINVHKSSITSSRFSPDGEKIIITTSDSSAKIWETNSGKFLSELKCNVQHVNLAEFTPDGKKIITVSGLGIQNLGSLVRVSKSSLPNIIIQIWDLVTGKLLNELITGPAQVRHYTVHVSPNGKRLISSFGDNTINIWDMQTGNELYRFLAIDTTDYLVYDKDYRYDGTPAARKLLYFTCGTEVIELDQVKDQLWVPNLAERIMKGDSINAKTLDELNICGLTPEVEDSSYKSDEYSFKILPRRGGLGETVLYLNGIEVKRYKPAELKNNGGTYELKIKKAALKDLFVAGKENRLTVKAFTSDNAISSRALSISEDKSKDKATAPNLFAVMVGVSDYKGDELDLKYPGKDATDISAVVSNAAKNLLNTDGTEHVFMYNLTTDKDHYQLPEKKSIKKVLEEIGNKATANDILLIFFAGHGVMRGSEDNKQFYFLTADASYNSSYGAVADVGISTSELTEWIKPANIKAQKRIMIFDACNSGQAIKDFVKLGNKEQGYIAARSDEKGQEIKAIEKLNNQSGLFILSASASNLAAYEMGRYSQGLLTYSLLKAIKQQPGILNEGKYLDVSKWFNAARETVSELSKETGARQDPQIVTNTNFNIGVVDEEVMAKIVLSNEKPLFAACNFQNADENNPVDNLGLNKLIDQQLNSISSRGTDAPIVYAGITSSVEAYSLSGRYNITGNAIMIKVFIIQNKEVKQKIDLTGTKDKLDELSSLIATRAAEWAGKNK